MEESTMTCARVGEGSSDMLGMTIRRGFVSVVCVMLGLLASIHHLGSGSYVKSDVD